MIFRYRSNLHAGLAGILLGAVLLYLIPNHIGMEYGDQETITSRTMPYAVAVVSLLCGAALVFQSLVLKKDTVKEVRLGQEAKALSYMGVLTLYCFIFPYGFILSTSFVAVATLAFSKSKKAYHYAVVLATVFLLYWVFTSVLHVRLP